MSKKILLVLALLNIVYGCGFDKPNPRKTILLDKGWLFINSEVENPEGGSNNLTWQHVDIPHDWAISGEFDENNDLIMATVIEDGERVPQKRTGRTGALPHVGIGWYKKVLDIPESWEGQKVYIEFDGAMSHSKVFLNGEFVGGWPYGYASFGFDLTKNIKFGKKNTLTVRLENKPNSSRWYPGAGIYRNVRLVVTNPVHVKQWGTYITTPVIEKEKGIVEVATTIVGGTGPVNGSLMTEITNKKGIIVGYAVSKLEINGETGITQKIKVVKPKLWSLGNPELYKAISYLYVQEELVDQYETIFGFRSIGFTSNHGFFLNGERVQLKGVCLHHDLGPLGAAVNKSALRFRMKMLQEMGCNSIRTSHNPPTPELLDLADEMGLPGN